MDERTSKYFVLGVFISGYSSQYYWKTASLKHINSEIIHAPWIARDYQLEIQIWRIKKDNY